MENAVKQSRTVGVVIPAFNEAENLNLVLNTVCAVDWVREIVLVDDGSSDCTLDVAQRAAAYDNRLIVIHLPENQGKAAAMVSGIQVLRTDLVIFLDADLIGLKPLHLQQLTSLQKSGSCEMAVAIFQVGHVITNIPQHLVPQLSGQRCLWREEAEQALFPLAADRYGVETGLTLHARLHHWKIRKITWRGVSHRQIFKKRQMIAGLHNRWQMYSQIMTVIARTSGYSRTLKVRRVRPVKKNRITLR